MCAHVNGTLSIGHVSPFVSAGTQGAVFGGGVAAFLSLGDRFVRSSSLDLAEMRWRHVLGVSEERATSSAT